MRRHFHILVTLVLIFMIPGSSLPAQKIEYITVPELEKILNIPDNKLIVVNFWATWCSPCVKELPYFEKVAKDFDTGKVRFILVSLDFKSQIEKQLIPFLKKNKITLDVAVMMDNDYNSWIDKVDPSWQGNIPATLFYNNSKRIRLFHPEEIDEAELKRLITSFI